MSSIKHFYFKSISYLFSQSKGRQFSSGEQVTCEQDKRKDKKTRNIYFDDISPNADDIEIDDYV